MLSRLSAMSLRLSAAVASRWTEGRQGSGYLKFPLTISKRLKFDSYILKFPEGSFIDTQTRTYVADAPKTFSNPLKKGGACD